MGWLYMYSLDGHKTPKAYLDNQLTYSNERVTSKVLDSASKLGAYYAAVEHAFPDGRRDVFAVICLVNYRKSGYKDGTIFGYKDMSENMGPYEVECPLRILDLLTPTDNENANQWRQACRARAVKRLPKPDETFKLAHPLKFTNGQTYDTFQVERFGKKTRYRSAEGIVVRLSRLRDREFTIVKS